MRKPPSAKVQNTFVDAIRTKVADVHREPIRKVYKTQAEKITVKLSLTAFESTAGCDNRLQSTSSHHKNEKAVSRERPGEENSLESGDMNESGYTSCRRTCSCWTLCHSWQSLPLLGPMLDRQTLSSETSDLIQCFPRPILLLSKDEDSCDGCCKQVLSVSSTGCRVCLDHNVDIGAVMPIAFDEDRTTKNSSQRKESIFFTLVLRQLQAELAVVCTHGFLLVAASGLMYLVSGLGIKILPHACSTSMLTPSRGPKIHPPDQSQPYIQASSRAP